MTLPPRVRDGVAWGLFAAWAAGVWWLSSRTDPGEDLDVDVPDKVAHGLEFAVGGFLARRAFSSVRASAAAPALLTCAAWGAVDECHQGHVPGRETDPWDLVADVTGAAAGVAVQAAAARSRDASARGSR